MFLLGLLRPVLGLLGGKITRLEIYVLLAAGLAFAGWFWLREHDARVLAQEAARAQAKVAAQQLADQRAATAQVQAVADAAQARADALTAARLEIAHAIPPAAACGPPAAVLRAVGALRASP